MPDTSRRVQAVIDRFVTDLSNIAREEAARVVLGSLGPTGRAHTASPNGAHGRGEKRSPERLEALQSKLLGFVKSHPGLRIEEINKQLGTSTKDLALPIRKLLAGKQIKAEGQRRATKYFAGGNAAAKGGAKRPKKK